MSKRTLTVKWVIAPKKMIKFIEEDDNNYKIPENLMDVAGKLTPNSVVDVETEGTNVVSIVKHGDKESNPIPKPEVKAEQPKETSAQETKKEPASTKEDKVVEKKTLTFNYKSKDKCWYVFQETGDKVWFGVDENVKPYLEKIEKGTIVEVSYESRNNGKKDINYITFVTVVKLAENKQENAPQTTKKQNYSSMEEAKAKNTAAMNAKDIVVALINNGKLEGSDEINKALKGLTKVNYEAINEL